MDVKAIPAFYCVYLLRSTVRKASIYIGSTPHPSRRLGQHNGRVKGGAVRTSRTSLRPWEMTCVVAGFPSNIAALQFEWAWHNAHLTRHISPEQRISFATTLTKTNSKTGKARRRPGRPRSSLLDKLSNLHLLLRVPYFSRWPLEIRFFSEEVYHSWQGWCERVDDQIRPGIKIFLDPQKVDQDEEITSAQRPAKKRKIDLIGKGGVDGVDPTYAQYQDVLTKATFILDEGDNQECEICSKTLDIAQDLFTICPNTRCQSLSHVTCLSKHFTGHGDSGQLVPERGKCPSCQTQLQWADLMREMTLRTRGQKDVKKLLSKKRSTKAATAAEILETESEDEADEGEDLRAADVVDDEDDAEDMDESDGETRSVASMDSIVSLKGKMVEEPKHVGRLEIVIEDSDDDG